MPQDGVWCLGARVGRQEGGGARAFVRTASSACPAWCFVFSCTAARVRSPHALYTQFCRRLWHDPVQGTARRTLADPRNWALGRPPRLRSPWRRHRNPSLSGGVDRRPPAISQALGRARRGDRIRDGLLDRRHRVSIHVSDTDHVYGSLNSHDAGCDTAVPSTHVWRTPAPWQPPGLAVLGTYNISYTVFVLFSRLKGKLRYPGLGGEEKRSRMRALSPESRCRASFARSSKP